MKSEKHSLKYSLILVLLFLLLTNTDANTRNYAQPGLCNINVEIQRTSFGDGTSCSSFVDALWDVTVYWGGISEAASNAQLFGRGGCKTAIMCDGLQIDTFCDPYIASNSGFDGQQAYWIGTAYSYNTNSQVGTCPDGYPRTTNVEVFCSTFGWESRTLYGPCRNN